jgi:UDP-GlcNAc:undecaprenyl-phosphate/decaprenyl-phosphate GlcNAc-1-phosphate transferase
MPYLFVLGLLSFLLSLMLTPFFRDLFSKHGILDKPDDGRKLHRGNIPRVGGIPIAVAYITALTLAAFLPVHTGALVRHAVPLAIRLLPAAGLIFSVGLIDDVYGLTAKQKLCGQVVAACIVLAAGIRVDAIGGHFLPIWVSVAATIVWLIGCTNALNLIDGLDGLAAGVGLFATLTALITGLLSHNFELAAVTAPLVGALLGFLRFNFNPASIFLGDSGSLLIGFLLGCFGILWSQKSATVLGITAPLIALSVPLIDVGLAVVRRFLRQQPIFAPDRGHIHHRLLARGLTPRRVALTLYMACTLCAVLSLLQSFADEKLAIVIVILFCVCAWFGIQRLKYIEFGTAGQLVLGGGLRRLLNARISLAGLEDTLKNAPDFNDCWKIIEKTYEPFGFADVEFELNGSHKKCGLNDRNENIWSVTIYLEDDYVRLYRRRNATVDPALSGSYIECLRNGLMPHVQTPKVMVASSRT